MYIPGSDSVEVQPLATLEQRYRRRWIQDSGTVRIRIRLKKKVTRGQDERQGTVGNLKKHETVFYSYSEII